MSAMSIRDRIRKWLGIEDVARKSDIQASELRHKQRAKSAHEDEMRVLNRIEQRLINQHVGNQVNRSQPQEFVSPVLDWDAVTAANLHDLEANPEKEN
jgi:hypothetical protein